jgi:hypothetical protein
LGALDETAYLSKASQGSWLHAEISDVARRVVGVDKSLLVPDEGLPTGPRSVIYRGDADNLCVLLQKQEFSPTVVVAGELIEHVPNALAFLTNLRSVSALRGSTLILTTPNATGLPNRIVALLNRESAHEDHLAIFSYKTLSTLFRRAGFSCWQLRPYYARFPEMKGRVKGAARLGLSVSEKLVNGIEYAFPMLSFGWIGTLEI